MPKRIQRSRKKGWRMPAGAVYVGRPSKWGNPWKDAETFDYAIDRFGGYYHPTNQHEFIMVDEIKKHLRGKDLACWCPLDKPCHADVLLRIANRDIDIR